ncbi:MAG: hypothetical protein OEW17_07290 [Gemmatimonadota bacterium]|nr:hypothetical protein [Gemmatimonadota bacterium]
MRYRLLPVLVLVLSACGGGSASSPEPSLAATTPEGAVRLFFQAVADSNVAGMARLWGTSNGPALVTGKPADYARRMEVTQLFLRNSPYRVTASTPSAAGSDQRDVQVELDRTDLDGKRCVRTISAVVVNAGKHGWIVEAIDLNQAGTPGRSCAGGAVPAEG